MNEYVDLSVGQSWTQISVPIPGCVTGKKSFFAINSLSCFLKGHIFYISEWSEDENPD